jgi:hypothetical protein
LLLFVLFGCYLCCFMYYLCVNVYCLRVTTQVQLTNISYHNYKLVFVKEEGHKSLKQEFIFQFH